MADTSNIIIKEITEATFLRKDGSGSFEIVTIHAKDGTQYEGFKNKLPELSNGQKIEIIFQPIKIGSGIKNQILTIKERGQTMTKQQNTQQGNQATPKFFKITGTVFFAHVKDKDTKGLYPSDAYKLDLSIDQDTATKLQNLGVQIKNKGDEKGNFVTLKSKQFQPRVTLPNGEKVSGNDIPLIGNGSTATITTSLYDNTEANARAGKGGRKLLGLNDIQLLNLIEYTAPNLTSL